MIRDNVSSKFCTHMDHILPLKGEDLIARNIHSRGWSISSSFIENPWWILFSNLQKLHILHHLICNDIYLLELYMPKSTCLSDQSGKEWLQGYSMPLSLKVIVFLIISSNSRSKFSSTSLLVHKDGLHNRIEHFPLHRIPITWENVSCAFVKKQKEC